MEGTPATNQILARPLDTALQFDLAHRAIRPRSLPQDKPEDLICRIHNFPQYANCKTSNLKATVLPFTKTWAFRRITKALMEKNIKFRWNFPFALVVQQQGKAYSIVTPVDVPAFEEALGLSDNVEDWTGLSMASPRQLFQRPRWQRTPKNRRRQTPSGLYSSSTPKDKVT
ncbi:Hypothetical predicted protein [Pelobates cultripes]|uniref:Uncharacterized protein n=1 Tax=Pelobates cultripes TaxID=61616 RepID=A0AAD1WHI7_PELCU|nr:Hypothetical predicted protein [Pelobates cultripes]